MKEKKKKIKFEFGLPIHLYECNYQSGNWEKIVHNHDYIEIAIITGGIGIHKINNEDYTATIGEVYIINTESMHLFTPTDDKNIQNISQINLSI